MPRYCKAQDGRLTLIFDSIEDIRETSKDLIVALSYLMDKYSRQEQEGLGRIVAVLDIEEYRVEEYGGTSIQ